MDRLCWAAGDPLMFRATIFFAGLKLKRPGKIHILRAKDIQRWIGFFRCFSPVPIGGGFLGSNFREFSPGCSQEEINTL